MAAAFALGAEGVQMGTRMVSAAESPVHEHFKQAICAAQETDTVFLNRFHRPGLRALRTGFSEKLEREEKVELSVLGRVLDLYFGGDMEASIALSGQVAGRIESVKPVAQIFRETLAEFREASAKLAALAGCIAMRAPQRGAVRLRASSSASRQARRVLRQARRIALRAAVQLHRLAHAARDQVQVVVEDGLAGGGAVQLEDADAVRRKDLAHRLRQAPRQRSDRGEIRVLAVEQVDRVALRDHQHVSVRGREEIHEDERARVLAHHVRRRLLAHDLAEDALVRRDAFVHGISFWARAF